MVVPSHFASSASLIGSSLGGSSFTGFLGAKPFGSAAGDAEAMVAGWKQSRLVQDMQC